MTRRVRVIQAFSLSPAESLNIFLFRYIMRPAALSSTQNLFLVQKKCEPVDKRKVSSEGSNIGKHVGTGCYTF